MKYIKVFILLSLILASEVFSSGGSYYSRYGLGDFYYSFTARRMGMGDLGIAAIDPDFLSNLNPASWSNLRLTRFETGIIYQGTDASTTQSSFFKSQTIFSGLMFGFPISHTYGISFVGGLTPYSNVSYDVSEKIDSNIVDNHTLNYKGDGGIYKTFLGLSYKLPFDFSLGASFDYYTGRIKYSTGISFDSPSNYYNVAYNKEYNYHGVGFTFGLISNNFADILGIENLNDLRFGFTYSNKVDLSTDSLSSVNTVVGTMVNSTFSFKTKLPYRLGIGFLSKWYNEYQVTLDYLYQPLSQFRDNGMISENMRDFQKFSLGLEYRKYRPESTSFWDHVSYRSGVSFEQSQYTFVNQGINQASIYAGLSLPMGYDNTVDFAFQYGKRGTTNNNLLNEKFYKLSMTLSIGELWFIREDR